MAIAQESILSEPAVKPFLAPNFSPVDHLNAILPTLSLPNSSGVANSGPSLSEVTSQCQAQISKISTQLTRLSTTLTRLTDDILRSGSRLAYEVEILHGATKSLKETLNEGLANDLAHFDPAPVIGELAVQGQYQEREAALEQRKEALHTMQKLKTLVQVRNRLDEVVKIFGKAMEWPAPPLEQQKSGSIATSLVSISAPETPGVKAGLEYADKARKEVLEMLRADEDGADPAHKRIEELRDLATVWKGTGQAKARTRFVDSLETLVEEQLSKTKSKGGYGYTNKSSARDQASIR